MRDDSDDIGAVDIDDLLHQLRALVGAQLRAADSGASAELARAFAEMDKRLREGTVLPRAWQRSAVATLNH